MILILDNRTLKYTKILKNANVIIKTNSGLTCSGRVRTVREDTIFLADTLFRVADIDSLFFPTYSPVPGGPKPSGGKRIVYAAGSPDWQVTILPDSIFRKWNTYRNYSLKPIYQARAEKKARTYPFLYRNFLKVNITKIFHLEAAVAYERQIGKKSSWETELSAIFGIPSADAHYNFNYPLYNYSGFSVTTNPKFYIINSRTYISPVFMYRYLWAVGIRTGWPGYSDTGLLQDQYRNDFGLSARFGFMKRYGRFVIDFYAGLGIKYILLHQLVYGAYEYHDSDRFYWYNPDHSPDVYDKNLLGPVINAGIKIGVAF